MVAPIDCVGVSIKNSAMVDMSIRTDSNDSTTQDLIPAGSIEDLPARSYIDPQGGATGSRFRSGDTVCYLQAATGTGPALITYVV